MASTMWQVRTHHDEDSSPVLAPKAWPQVDADSALLFINSGKSCCRRNALHFSQDMGCDVGQLQLPCLLRLCMPR